MKKILHISSSPRGEASSSILLANRIIEKIENLHPGSTVVVNDTTKKDYPHLDAAMISAYRATDQPDVLKESDAAVQELFEADVIVIGVPMYNFNMPSALKAWIDHIVRPGVTFSYANGKPEGLLKDKKVYLAMAANGVYSDGPMKPYDFSEPYLRFMLGFLGLTDITIFRIEGGAIPGIMETAVQKGLDSVAVN